MERIRFSDSSANSTRFPRFDYHRHSTGKSRSRIAGHVLSSEDKSSPVMGAHLMLNFREIRCDRDGLFEAPLDALPPKVDLLITARGFHAHQEVLDWTPVAAGGLILRDFFLAPLSMPAPRPRKPFPEPGKPGEEPEGRKVTFVDLSSDDLLPIEESDAQHTSAFEKIAGGEPIEEGTMEEQAYALDWEDVDDEFSEIADEIESSLDPSNWKVLSPEWRK